MSEEPSSAADSLKQSLRGIPAGMTLREFLIDLIACFVPGTLFVALMIACYAWPCHMALGALRLESVGIPHPESLFASLRAEISAVLIAAAYVMGFIMYRSDPKKPDAESFEAALRRAADEERKQPDSQTTWEEGWVANRSSGCEYPYVNLKGYLQRRGLDTLAQMVPWEPDRAGSRTKNFVNALKNRIEFYYPEKAGVVTRNEAHVRFMSSMWYVSFHLCWWSFISAVICVGLPLLPAIGASFRGYLGGTMLVCGAAAAVFIVLWHANIKRPRGAFVYRTTVDAAPEEHMPRNDGRPRLAAIALGLCSLAALVALAAAQPPCEMARDAGRALPGVVAAAAVYVFAWRLRLKIDEFLHYQRVREVFFVLDLAAIAFADNRPQLRGVVADEWIESREDGDSR
jgi:hypothetical protein